jgi:predicted adenylyl cyclase CyaB
VRIAVPPSLAPLLASALGEVAVVEKTRRLYLWRDVRIHLDTVERLGSFVELEAVAAPGSDLSAEEDALAELRRALAIRDEDLLGESYAELLRAAAP